MLILKNPYWYKLLKVFKNTETKYRITTGLTIPFLFGAYKILQAPFENIEHLVASVRDIEIDKFPIIQKCPDIGKHVIMVQEKSYCNKHFSDFPKLESEISKNSLLISTNSLLLGKTFDRVCYNLTAEYLDTIKKREFSWSKAKGKWRKFEDGEIELIKSVS